MVKHITGNIFSFPITLPRSPLKYLNCYVIKSGSGKNLLIDTGYDLPESWRDLQAGIDELGLAPENTDVFLTHIHADHTGNAKRMRELGYTVRISEKDYQGVINSHLPGFYGAKQKAKDAGTPEAVLEAMFVNNPSPIMLPEVFTAETVRPGDRLEYGGHRLVCLSTYGHSPGHMSLYDEENRIIFLGDHVLFDITPNIVLWNRDDDALGQYIENLRAVQKLPISLALPAHRTAGSVSLNERIDSLIRHHMRRTEEIQSIIRREEGLTAYEISSRMKWNIVAAGWDDFPASQKYFAVCECMAHLQYMCLNGMASKAPGPDNVMLYFVK